MGRVKMPIQERRSATRYFSSSKGYVILNGVDLDLETHDISSCGALIALESRHAIREGVKLCVHLDIGHVGTAVVRRATLTGDRTMLALQFEERLPETLIH